MSTYEQDLKPVYRGRIWLLRLVGILLIIFYPIVFLIAGLWFGFRRSGEIWEDSNYQIKVCFEKVNKTYI